MRLQGKIKNTKVIILVNSRSTHNFMNCSVAKRVGCSSQAMSGVGVTIANGQKIWVQDMCKAIAWETEGLQMIIDFMLLPLRGCDIVLGVHSVQELGLIFWDFKALTMQFTFQGQQFTLHGMLTGAV